MKTSPLPGCATILLIQFNLAGNGDGNVPVSILAKWDTVGLPLLNGTQGTVNAIAKVPGGIMVSDQFAGANL